MVKIFGLDVAAIVSQSISSAGNLRPATVTRSVAGDRDSEDITGGRSLTTVTSQTQGFVETVSEYARAATTIHHEVRGLLIAQMMTFVPTAGDRVTIDGKTWTIVGPVKTDPAGASHEFLGK